MPFGILENLTVDLPDVNSASQLDYYSANKSDVSFYLCLIYLCGLVI